MKHSKWLILLCVVATLGLTGCSDDDDVVIPPAPGPAAAEAVIEDALETVIDPLLTLMEFAIDFLSADDGTDVIGCPDTSGVCNPGSLTCTEGTSALEFDFSGCTILGTSPALSVSGEVYHTPSLPPWGVYNLYGVSVNGSTGLTGPVTLADECTWTWSITAADGTHTNASLILCQTVRGASEYPLSGSALVIAAVTSAGFMTSNFTFDGTRTASATVLLDESPLAQCSVDLETFNATCTGVDI